MFKMFFSPNTLQAPDTPFIWTGGMEIAISETNLPAMDASDYSSIIPSGYGFSDSPEWKLKSTNKYKKYRENAEILYLMNDFVLLADFAYGATYISTNRYKFWTAKIRRLY